jgi:hypothetical protein
MDGEGVVRLGKWLGEERILRECAGESKPEVDKLKG